MFWIVCCYLQFQAVYDPTSATFLEFLAFYGPVVSRFLIFLDHSGTLGHVFGFFPVIFNFKPLYGGSPKRPQQGHIKTLHRDCETLRVAARCHSTTVQLILCMPQRKPIPGTRSA